MQRRDAGLLHKGRHAGDLGRIQQGQFPNQLRRSRQIPGPPAGHGVGLGKALAQQQLSPQVGVLREPGQVRRSQALVDLIACLLYTSRCV